MAKSLDDRLFLAVERGDSLAIDLARRDIEREASERYKGFVVTSRLKRAPKETVKCNAFVREEEVRKFPHRYIEFVESPDGHVRRSNGEICVDFRAHFRDCFARCPDLPLSEFRSYLTDLLRLW